MRGVSLLVAAVAMGLAPTHAGAGLPTNEIPDALFGSPNFPAQVLEATTGNFDDDCCSDIVVTVWLNGLENGVAVIGGAMGGYGRVTGTAGTTEVSFSSMMPGDHLGEGLAAGDVDGDGRDDLLVGAPGGNVIDGQVLLLRGASYPQGWGSEVVAESYARLVAGGQGSRFGKHVAVGHLDEDAFEDIAVCAPQENNEIFSEVGAVFIWFGRQAWPAGPDGSPAPDVTYLGEGQLCSAIAARPDPIGGVGKVLLLGDAQAAGGAGRVYVVRPQNDVDGVNLQVQEVAKAVITGEDAGDGFGAAVAATTSLPIGNEAAELLVGIPGYASGQGAVYIFDLASLVTPDEPYVEAWEAQVKVFGSWAGGELGATVVGAKDFGGGNGGAWLGAPGAGLMTPGGGAVLYLSPAAVGNLGGEMWGEEIPGAVIGVYADAHAGAALARGDIDGDGMTDVVIAEPDSQEGTIYLLRSDAIWDGDGDGWLGMLEDCDDELDFVAPFEDEVCDGFDSNCDGEVPEDEWDEDGDMVPICDGDCEDQDSSIFPGAGENCDDGVDNDCDGDVDGADDECGGSGDDDGGDDDGGDDDAAGDEDGNPAGFQCECQQGPGPTAVMGPLSLLSILLLVRRRP